MIFDPKKGGGHFFDIFGPHPLSSKTQKSGFQVVGGGSGGGGGFGRKTHWGMCLLDKIVNVQRFNQTIETLEVGYANSPKKAQKGVCGVFFHIPACMCLI